MKEAAIKVHFEYMPAGKLSGIVVTQRHVTNQEETVRLSPAQARSLAKTIMVKLRGAH